MGVFQNGQGTFFLEIDQHFSVNLFVFINFDSLVLDSFLIMGLEGSRHLFDGSKYTLRLAILLVDWKGLTRVNHIVFRALETVITDLRGPVFSIKIRVVSWGKEIKFFYEIFKSGLIFATKNKDKLLNKRSTFFAFLRAKKVLKRIGSVKI